MPSKRDAMTARALALVGCGYIYGATGWICTRARMEQQMRQYPTYAGQIERYGKKWLGKPCYDCAQLTRDVARRAGVRLPSGATSQWRAAGIWKEKDVIDTLPDEAGLFLYTMRDGRMTHTGVSIGRGEEVDARRACLRRGAQTDFRHIVHALGAAEYRLRCAGYGGKSNACRSADASHGQRRGRCAHAAKHAEAARLFKRRGRREIWRGDAGSG